jgi:hypothetical protein
MFIRLREEGHQYFEEEIKMLKYKLGLVMLLVIIFAVPQLASAQIIIEPPDKGPPVIVPPVIVPPVIVPPEREFQNTLRSPAIGWADEYVCNATNFGTTALSIEFKIINEIGGVAEEWLAFPVHPEDSQDLRTTNTIHLVSPMRCTVKWDGLPTAVEATFCAVKRDANHNTTLYTQECILLH